MRRAPSAAAPRARARPRRLRRGALPTVRPSKPAASSPPEVPASKKATTILAQGGQDIGDGIQKMDALERAAHHEFETAVRGASGAERQQSLCTLRGVRRLAADRAQVVAALAGAWSAWPGRAKPAARF